MTKQIESDTTAAVWHKMVRGFTPAFDFEPIPQIPRADLVKEIRGIVNSGMKQQGEIAREVGLRCVIILGFCLIFGLQ